MSTPFLILHADEGLPQSSVIATIFSFLMVGLYYIFFCFPGIDINNNYAVKNKHLWYEPCKLTLKDRNHNTHSLN